ncbi:hypothetical protein, partial [Enterocloster bolteae]|uniref:hypothetical protein n=1 Tax=Enterocloster bolteae TaxID=208479 RepID=UPI002A82A1DB
LLLYSASVVFCFCMYSASAVFCFCCILLLPYLIYAIYDSGLTRPLPQLSCSPSMGSACH